MRLVAIGCAAAVCFVFGCSRAGDAPPVESAVSLADSLIRLGDSTYRQDSDSARRLWQHALAEATARGDSANVARALTGIGMAARLDGDWDDARRIGEQALAIKQRLGLGSRDLFRSYNALALVAWNSQRLDDATELLARAGESALAANDSTALALVSINTGLIAKDLGAFDRSRAALLAGRDIARSRGDSVNLGRALINLAMLDLALGDPIAAIAWIEESRQLARLTGDSITEVNARGQLANAYATLGEPQRAFALLDSALTMAQRAGRRQEVAEDLLLVGDLFLEAGDYQHALDYYLRARAATDSIEQADDRGNILRSEAQAHLGLGNLAAARFAASDALRIHRAAAFPFQELNDLIVLSDISVRDGQSSEADRLLDNAERLARRLEAPIALTMVSVARARLAARESQWSRVLEAFDRTRGTLHLVGKGGEAEAWSLRARALGELGRYDAALAAGRQAIEAMETVRGNYDTGELRTSYTSSRADVYAQHVLLLLRRGRVGEAFEVADAARGRALLEHLTEARADLQSGAGASQLLEQETMLRRIDALLGELRVRERTAPRQRSAEHRATTAGLRDSVEALRAGYSALVARTASMRSTSRDVLGVARPRSSDIRRSLRDDEVLLEYLVTPDQLLIFAVTATAVTVHTVDQRAEELTSRVQLVRELLRRPDSESEARGVLRALFDIVLAPALGTRNVGDAKRLIIVPYGVLTYLPFAALVDSTSRYVAEQFVLLQLPTSAALPALRAPVSPVRRELEVEVFAPVPRALPATRLEAEAVASAMERAETYLGSRATEAQFRSALQRAGIVHVASHATLNPRNPLFSYIELAGGRRGVGADDGRLEAHELLSMQIAASLVFLSGCETAMGGAWSTRFDTGEDYAAIAQTFLYAGARNVVATLWRIDDDGAAEFARHFYVALRGAGYAEAIAEAQRKLLSDPRYRSPYYWAPYQVMGGGAVVGAKPTAVSDKR